MAETTGDDPLSARKREQRIAEIKRRLEQMSDGGATFWESSDLAAEEREQFWRHVIDFETAPRTTDFERLVRAGVELPAPASIDDASLTAKLWEVIDALARIGIFIFHTDHLSDRELYAHLWSDSLRCEVPAGSEDAGGVWHVDLIGTGSEEHIHLYFKFYADNRDRREWLVSYPDYAMPPREKPAYDRDRYLPHPPFRA